MKLGWMIGLTLIAVSQGAFASSLLYHGNNPNISPSANPNNGPNIAAEAALSRPTNPRASTPTTGLSEANLLKQSVISGLSSRYQQILTSNATSTGRVDFGDGSYANYTTSNGTRFITFYNVDGTNTTISFPI